MPIHILGIRHHGPGSAKNVKEYLEQVKPDIVLVEGPPEANDLLQWAGHAELKPPVSILIYNPDQLKQALFYPFAQFSPEWQAIQYANKNNVPVRFMDLPVYHYFGIKYSKEKTAEVTVETRQDIDEENTSVEIEENEQKEELLNDTIPKEEIYSDPISQLAIAAGFQDGEAWWERQIEYSKNTSEIFTGINEAMSALRQHYPNERDQYKESLREAYMRKVIREAQKENFATIAVICGAWHAPELNDLTNSKKDNELLKGLPRVKTAATWTPWTYNRLGYDSGYGAGITSPGWYHHLWKYPNDNGTRWMIKVAKLLRKKNMDVSVAHVIEAVRLAETLAVLRNFSRPGLDEMNEAVLTVICHGESILMDLIHKELIVSNRIGSVPSEIPKPPLQQDIEKLQKKLRLPATADSKEYILDLRKELDLHKSIFLHRMELLEINWGEKQRVSNKGTFKEQWKLQWDPGLSIDIIEKGALGNTVEEAANRYILDQAEKNGSLIGISTLLENTLPAELPNAVKYLIAQINNLAATSGDVIQLMEVIPGLVSVSRYGNVRNTDSELVLSIAKTMILRVCISMPAACTSVNDEAAAKLLDLILKINDSINLLNDPEIIKNWQETLQIISFNQTASPSISGYATRLLYDYKIITTEKLNEVFSFFMSIATLPSITAAWLEGFLQGSGTVLLIDNLLWKVIDDWVNKLNNDDLTLVLPLLRRTFSQFTKSERKKLGEKAKNGISETNMQVGLSQEVFFDQERALLGIPVVLQMLGLNKSA